MSSSVDVTLSRRDTDITCLVIIDQAGAFSADIRMPIDAFLLQDLLYLLPFAFGPLEGDSF